jgi:hypothetical protein
MTHFRATARSGDTLASMRGWSVPCLLAAMIAAPMAYPQGPAAQSQPTQVYSDAELHLTFRYSADLQPMDAKALADASNNSRFGADSGENTDTPQAGACSKLLLSVGKVVAVNGAKAWGTLTMIDIGPGCIPPKAQKNKKAMDALLKQMVTGGTQILGMMPLGTATAYPIQDHKVHFAGAQGQPVAQGDLQPTEQTQTIAHMAVELNDHIVLWKVESNNSVLLNRILASQVDFGAGTPEPLFPGRLQNDLQF